MKAQNLTAHNIRDILSGESKASTKTSINLRPQTLDLVMSTLERVEDQLSTLATHLGAIERRTTTDLSTINTRLDRLGKSLDLRRRGSFHHV